MRWTNEWRWMPAALALAGAGLALGPAACSPSGAARPTVLAAAGEEEQGVEAWEFAGANGRVIRTANYRIHTTTESGEMLLRFPAFVEAALAHYRTAIVELPAPDRRLDTFVFADRPQWIAFTEQLMGSRASQYSQIRRGGYSTGGRAVFWDIGLFDTMAIAAHEGWHQYTQKTFVDSLPVWLEEGIGTYMEGHRWRGRTPEFMPWSNPERFDQLRRAYYRDQLIPLSELLESRPEEMLGGRNTDVLNYYAQVWALVHFLNEGERGKYKGRLETMLLDAGKGQIRQRVSASLRKREQSGSRQVIAAGNAALFHVYFNDDLDAAQREYRAFIGQIVSSGSRQLMLQGRTPIRNSPRSAEQP